MLAFLIEVVLVQQFFLPRNKKSSVLEHWVKKVLFYIYPSQQFFLLIENKKASVFDSQVKQVLFGKRC
jgi:hypothetical protein